MTDPIGIRLPREFIEKIDKISKIEMLDRSTIIRKLVMLGYLELIRKNAAEKYINGYVTLSKAAELSQLTIWEMEKYLVERGFKSDYSIDDFEKELEMLKQKQ